LELFPVIDVGMTHATSVAHLGESSEGSLPGALLGLACTDDGLWLTVESDGKSHDSVFNFYDVHVLDSCATIGENRRHVPTAPLANARSARAKFFNARGFFFREPANARKKKLKNFGPSHGAEGPRDALAIVVREDETWYTS
jgi:hypothetical protein